MRCAGEGVAAVASANGVVEDGGGEGRRQLANSGGAKLGNGEGGGERSQTVSVVEDSQSVSAVEADSKASRSCEEAVNTGDAGETGVAAAAEGSGEKGSESRAANVLSSCWMFLKSGSGEEMRCAKGVNTGEGAGDAVEADGRGEKRSHGGGVAGGWSLSSAVNDRSETSTCCDRAGGGGRRGAGEEEGGGGVKAGERVETAESSGSEGEEGWWWWTPNGGEGGAEAGVSLFSATGGSGKRDEPPIAVKEEGETIDEGE